MIAVTRLDGTTLLLNHDLIVSIEETPDTLVTLRDDVRVMVREPANELVERIVAFRRRLLGDAAALAVRTSGDVSQRPAGSKG